MSDKQGKNKKVFDIHKPEPRFPVIEEIQKRFSPRFFSDEKVSAKDLDSIFEAARWTPSGHNNQPWYFHLTHKNSESYKKLFSTLNEYNQSWAYSAPLLIVASKILRDDKYEFEFADYDLGAAVMSLVLQAQSLGYYSRQMALFDKEKVKELFSLDKNMQPCIVIAMGKVGDFEKAPQEVFEYELDPRPRKEKIFEALE
ncbi:MAG: nitroreductase family protein [Patescibacteria group bacterium]